MNIDLEVSRREHAPPANARVRRWQPTLVHQPIEKLVNEPAGDLFALARIDEAEVQEMDQQHLPMNFHVLEQALPVNFIIRAQDQVGHVGAIIAVTVLDEALRSEEHTSELQSRENLVCRLLL